MTFAGNHPPYNGWCRGIGNSTASPIARAMIGKEEGDVIEVTAPGGARSYEIVKVKY
jgi:hypothetical protein